LVTQIWASYWKPIKKEEGEVGFVRGFRISTLLFGVGLVYFAVHFFVGQQGLLSWRAYVQRADELSLEKEALLARKQALELNVARLTAQGGDRDFLEELAFAKLGLVGPGDVLIPLPSRPLAPTTQDGGQTGTALPPSAQTPNL
jgi:cell division protein FtsB